MFKEGGLHMFVFFFSGEVNHWGRRKSMILLKTVGLKKCNKNFRHCLIFKKELFFLYFHKFSFGYISPRRLLQVWYRADSFLCI